MLGKVQLAAAAQPSSCVFTRGRRSLQVDSAKAALTNDAQRMETEGKQTTVKGQQVPVAPPRDAIVLHDGQQAMVPLVRCQLHNSTVNTATPASNFKTRWKANCLCVHQTWSDNKTRQPLLLHARCQAATICKRRIPGFESVQAETARLCRQWMYLSDLISRLFQLKLEVGGSLWHVLWQEVAENTSKTLTCISLILHSHG